jgi:hypothetical protein
MAPYHAHWQHAADILTAPWRRRGSRRTLLHAAIALALSFDTWRTLTEEQGLRDDQAIALMLRLTRDCNPNPGQAPRGPPTGPLMSAAVETRRHRLRAQRRVLSAALSDVGICRS